MHFKNNFIEKTWISALKCRELLSHYSWLYNRDKNPDQLKIDFLGAFKELSSQGKPSPELWIEVILKSHSWSDKLVGIFKW